MSKEVIQRILDVPDEKWWENIFRRDPMYDRVDQSEKKRFIDYGVKVGDEYAKENFKRFEGKQFAEIVEALGVNITHKTTYGVDGLLVFALFSAPNEIILFMKNLELFYDYIKTEQIDNLPVSFDLEKLLIAHELFHYFEANDPNLKLSDLRFQSFKFGPIKLSSKLIAVSEIAAMCFARRITNNTINPCALEILLQLPHNYERALKNLSVVLEESNDR